MMFFELVNGWDRYFYICDNVLVLDLGICVLKSLGHYCHRYKNTYPTL